jgi:CDP-diacylglycerol--glycerol-3-phosphate 3-phosphatidyltransferase
MFTQKFQAWVRRWAERGVGIFRDSPLTPNMLTLFGLAITAAGALLVALGLLLPGGIVLAFAGFFDVFDGALARASG